MQPSILLLGPTASGKTPLGQYMEKQELWGRRLVHFDFGEQLRGVAGRGTDIEGLSKQDIQTVVQVVTSNALLENSQFHIAASLFCSFLARHKVGEHDIVVLNGLPRHADQARDVESMARILLVLVLDCTTDVVRERILHNSGGDRAERTDDTDREVAKKLRLYRERTQPLIAYYVRKQVPLLRLTVTPESRPEDHVAALHKSPHPL